MLKISAKITRDISRFERKNTISGKYERYKTYADISGMLTGIEVLRFPSWQYCDLGITSFMGALTLNFVKNAIKMRKALKPIKQRAIHIKKMKKQ